MTYGLLSKLIYAVGAFINFLYILYQNFLIKSNYKTQVSFTLFPHYTGVQNERPHWPYGIFTYVSCVFWLPRWDSNPGLRLQRAPVLETGVLTATLRGDNILLTNNLLTNVKPSHFDNSFIWIHLVIFHCFIKNCGD